MNMICCRGDRQHKPSTDLGGYGLSVSEGDIRAHFQQPPFLSSCLPRSEGQPQGVAPTNHPGPTRQ
jgi:hypothetical protein